MKIILTAMVFFLGFDVSAKGPCNSLETAIGNFRSGTGSLLEVFDANLCQVEGITGVNQQSICHTKIGILEDKQAILESRYNAGLINRETLNANKLKILEIMENCK